MKFRIALWAGTGLLVAFFWAVLAWASFPATYERMRGLWTFITLTCPVAAFGMHHPVSLYESLLANAATYALVGLVVEICRRQLRHNK
jgi:hypothetical protein